MEEKEKTNFFHFRIDNLEVCNPCPPSSGGLEMRQWDKSFSFYWIIARWEEHKDGGFFLKFVGNRPFTDSVSPSEFWILARAGQEFLDRA